MQKYLYTLLDILDLIGAIFRLYIRLIYTLAVAVVAIAVLISTLNIYNIHLRAQLSNQFTVYYDAGSILLEDSKLIQQYISRRDTYFTSYFHSLYEPQVIIDKNVFTVYRQDTKQIQWNNNWYYYNLGERVFLLTDEPESIEMYENNFMIGPSLTLYGDPDSAFNYSFPEVFYSFGFNVVDVVTPCIDHYLANCKNRLNSYSERVERYNNSSDTFQYTITFEFGSELAQVDKTPTEAFIIPENFFVCIDPKDFSSCIDPAFQSIIPQRDIPVIIQKNGSIKKMRFEELALDAFHITNLKIPDYLITDNRPPILLEPVKTYYLIDTSQSVMLAITPQQKMNTSIETKFSALKFKPAEVCRQAKCTLSFAIQLAEIDK